MKEPDTSKTCAEQLHALAAPERIKIVRFLRDGEHNVSEIADHLKTALVNVGHHMSILRQAGMVQHRKEGRFVYYSLTPGFLQCDPESTRADCFNLGCCELTMPREEELSSDGGNG